MPEIALRTARDPDLDPDSKYKDRCRLSRAVADRLGLEAGSHLRVDAGPYATYYRVQEIRGDDPLVVHEDHLDRFGIDGERTVRVSTTLPQESRREARKQGGLAETLDDDGARDRVLVTAPHGGAVERGTDELAERIHLLFERAGIPASLWMLHGYNPSAGSAVSAHRRWHVGKLADGIDGYPGLRRLDGREFDLVIGVHRSGYDEIEVGGRIDAATRERVAERLHDLTGREVRSDPDRLRLPGTHPRISTNYLSADGERGLHVECTPGTCDRRTEAAARAIVEGVLPLVG